MNKKLSIIVPVYNTEKYLERCLDSLVSQTYSSLEIITVNDGSTDNSLNILNKYAQKDKRIMVIDRDNGGLSAARNTGILKATGDYLGFVDSDDWVDRDMYASLIKELEDNSADLVTCGFLPLYAKDLKPEIIEQKKALKAGEVKVYSAKDAAGIILQGKIAQVSACNKLYKRELFNELKYPEGRSHEDTFVIIKLLLECQKVVIDPNVRYYYYHRDDSIITKKLSLADYDLIEASQANYELVKDNYPSVLKQAEMRVLWSHFWLLDKAIIAEDSTLKDKTIKAEVEYLKQHYSQIISNPYLEVNRVKAMKVLKHSYPLYCLLVQLRQRKKKPNE